MWKLHGAGPSLDTSSCVIATARAARAGSKSSTVEVRPVSPRGRAPRRIMVNTGINGQAVDGGSRRRSRLGDARGTGRSVAPRRCHARVDGAGHKSWHCVGGPVCGWLHFLLLSRSSSFLDGHRALKSPSSPSLVSTTSRAMAGLVARSVSLLSVVYFASAQVASQQVQQTSQCKDRIGSFVSAGAYHTCARNWSTR